MKSTPKHSIVHTSIFRLYLAVAAFVGLIGAVIGYGSFGYAYVKNQIISDDEYVAGNRSYEIKACEEPTMPTNGKEGAEPVKKTEAEIVKCKTETRDRVIAERAYQLKDSAIGGGVWGTLFLVIFLIHFLFLVRSNKIEKD